VIGRYASAPCHPWRRWNESANEGNIYNYRIIFTAMAISFALYPNRRTELRDQPQVFVGSACLQHIYKDDK
jgi:hypothetical protein